MCQSVFYDAKSRSIPSLGVTLFLRILFVLASMPCWAGNWNGELSYRYGSGLREPTKGESVLNEMQLELGWNSAHSLGWNFDASAWARYEDQLEPEEFKDISLRRMIVSRNSRNWSLSLGKQDIVWGKMDAFPLLDVVNPRHIREFVLADEADTRIPVWLGSASYFWADQSLQFVVVPDLETNREPRIGGLFDPTSAQLPAGMEFEIQALDKPQSVPDNWELGIKWTGRAGPWELSGLVYDGWSNQPVYFIDVSDSFLLTAKPKSVQQTLIGLSGDAPYGAFVLRFESVYTNDGYRSFFDNTGLPVQRKQSEAHFAIGMDWTPKNTLIGAQLFHFENDGVAANLATPAGNYASAVIERTWLQRNLKLRVFSFSALEKNDAWLSVELRYQFKGRYELSFGGDWLSGDAEAFFGQFSNRDRLTTRLSIKW